MGRWYHLLLIGAMNPYLCGDYVDVERAWQMITRYQKRISQYVNRGAYISPDNQDTNAGPGARTNYLPDPRLSHSICGARSCR